VAGYIGAALTIPSATSKIQLMQLRSIFAELGIETFVRTDITCTNRQDLLRQLRRSRTLSDVLAVKCTNHAVGLVAARDRRVDMIFFDPAKRNVWFDHAIANVARAALEVNLSAVISNTLYLGKITKEINTARDHHVGIILSSGSISPALIRTPEQMAALGVLLGLSKDQARNALSSLPWSILQQNRDRQSNQYIEEGVKVVRSVNS